MQVRPGAAPTEALPLLCELPVFPPHPPSFYPLHTLHFPFLFFWIIIVSFYYLRSLCLTNTWDFLHSNLFFYKDLILLVPFSQWLSKSKKDSELLERVPWSATKILESWSISHMRKGWESWHCSAWRGEDWGGVLSVLINTKSAGIKWMGPGSFQWCAVTEEGAMGTNWNTGSSIQTWGITSCPEDDRALEQAAEREFLLELFKTHLDTFLCNVSVAKLISCTKQAL